MRMAQQNTLTSENAPPILKRIKSNILSINNSILNRDLHDFRIDELVKSQEFPPLDGGGFGWE